MKDKWKNNLGLKIGAFAFAVFLWWTVVNVEDPIQTKRYTTEVMFANTDVVTNAGMSYQIVGEIKTVTVTVKARRKVLGNIQASNIVATADFREMDEQTQLVPIRVKVTGFEGDYEEALANPRNLQVKTEMTETKSFPISVSAIGEVRQGYLLDKENTVAVPQSIEISGPKSSLGRIARVVAKVDVSELSKDVTMEAEVIYYDAADNIVDSSRLSSNCDKNGVQVRIELLAVKELTLDFDTAEISAADGYVFDGIDVEPQTLRVAAKSRVLKDRDSIHISSDALKKNNLKQSEEVIVDITEYLPDNIVLVDEAASSVVVNIKVEKTGEKLLTMPVRSVKLNHISDEYEVAYESDQAVELQFTGPKKALDALTLESVIAVVDLKKYQKEGTYKVEVQVVDLPANCRYLGGATIELTLKKKVQ